jgi:hypothetical protein
MIQTDHWMGQRKEELEQLKGYVLFFFFLEYFCFSIRWISSRSISVITSRYTQAPKLFSGLHFCLSECMSPGDSGRLRKLIAAAGGRVLEPSSSLQWRSLRGDSSPRPYFVFNGSAPEEFRASSLRMEVKEAMEHRAAGARVVGHLTVLHAVAAYDADVLDRKGRLCA